MRLWILHQLNLTPVWLKAAARCMRGASLLSCSLLTPIQYDVTREMLELRFTSSLPSVTLTFLDILRATADVTLRKQ